MAVGQARWARMTAAGALGGLLLVGCGRDPILDRAESLDGTARTGAPQAASPQTAGAKQPATVQPADPPPGKPAGPSPGKPGAPPPGVPDEPRPGGAVDGPTVVLSGTIDVVDDLSGRVHVDVFDGDQRAAAGGGAKRPSVVGLVRLDGPGAFSVQVPQSAQTVWVGGFVDVDGNGRPSPDEPSGWLQANPVSTAADVGGLRLILKADPPPASP